MATCRAVPRAREETGSHYVQVRTSSHLRSGRSPRARGVGRTAVSPAVKAVGSSPHGRGGCLLPGLPLAGLFPLPVLEPEPARLARLHVHSSPSLARAGPAHLLHFVLA